MNPSKNLAAKKYWDKRAFAYDKHQNHSAESRIYHELILDHIRNFLPHSKKKSRVLDAGGGTGKLGVEIARMGHEVVLTDISPRMIEIAKHRAGQSKLMNRMEFRTLDLENMSRLPDRSFDLSISEFYTLSYCGNPAKALRELVRLTRKGGIVIVSVANKSRLMEALVRKRQFERLWRSLAGETVLFDRAFPCSFFDEASLRTLMQKSGLQILNIFGHNKFTHFFREKELNRSKIRGEVLKLERFFADDSYSHAWALDLVGIGKK